MYIIWLFIFASEHKQSTERAKRLYNSNWRCKMTELKEQELMQYGYEGEYQRGGTYPFDMEKLQKSVLSVSSLLALVLFVGVAYYVYHRVAKPNTALMIGAGAWLVFVLVKSFTD
jgi:hypothetical protein